MSIHKVKRYVRRALGNGSLCEICESREAVATCHSCGRRVCPLCHDRQRAVCVACAESLCEVCNKALSVDACVLCGRIVCRTCSVELDYSRKVCLRCAELYRDPRAELEERIRRALPLVVKAWSEEL